MDVIIYQCDETIEVVFSEMGICRHLLLVMRRDWQGFSSMPHSSTAHGQVGPLEGSMGLPVVPSSGEMVWWSRVAVLKTSFHSTC